MFFVLSDRELLTSRVFDQRQLMIQCMTFNPTGDLLGWLSDYLQYVIFLCEDILFLRKLAWHLFGGQIIKFNIFCVYSQLLDSLMVVYVLLMV